MKTASIYVSGCWSDTDLMVGLSERVHGIGLSSHPACSAQWRKQRLSNPASTARLQRMQPIWAAVDVLTAHAAQRILRTTCRGRLGSARRGAGCTAFVVDPDVLLDAHALGAACAYYDALRFSAVIFAPSPSNQEATLRQLNMSFEAFLGLSTRNPTDGQAGAAAQHAHVLSAIPRLMGSRHVSFFSLHALDVLANLTRIVAPKFDLPKGLDMLTPGLLPSKGVDVLWTLEHTAPFVRLDSPSLRTCNPRRVRTRGASASLATCTEVATVS